MLIIAELKAGWPSVQTQQSVIDMTISATAPQYNCTSTKINTIAICYFKNETAFFFSPSISPRGVFSQNAGNKRKMLLKRSIN